MLVSIPVFKKSSGRVFLLKSSLAFPAFREGVYSQPWSGPTRCCPRKTQGICKQGSVSSAPAGHHVPREGHAPTQTGWQDDFWEAFASVSPAREGPGGFPSAAHLPCAGQEGPEQSRLPLPVPQLLLSPTAGSGAKQLSSSYGFTGTTVMIRVVC